MCVCVCVAGSTSCTNCDVGKSSGTKEIIVIKGKEIIKVGDFVVLQNGYAQVGDAGRGPLKVGSVGTVVEIGDQVCDNSNVCQFSNNGKCDDRGSCFNGTDTAD